MIENGKFEKLSQSVSQAPKKQHYKRISDKTRQELIEMVNLV